MAPDVLVSGSLDRRGSSMALVNEATSRSQFFFGLHAQRLHQSGTPEFPMLPWARLQRRLLSSGPGE